MDLIVDDRRAILQACRLVRHEPLIAALTVGLTRPDFVPPEELARYCARLGRSQGVTIEVLPGAHSVRVARRERAA